MADQLRISGGLPGSVEEDVPPVAPDGKASARKRNKRNSFTGEDQSDDQGPALRGTAISKLQDHQLPGDSFVSKRFETRRNFQPLIFLPCVLLAFSSDSVALVSETKAVMRDEKESCMWGKPASDLFTDQKYCPAIASFSPWRWTVGWYMLFLFTVLWCWYRGRSIHRKMKGGSSSYLTCYLDCERAGYTDRHLLAWFLVMTIAFVNSLSIRLVSTPPNTGNWLDACLRYGDWTGHWDQCQPGGLLEPTWTIVLVSVYFCFAASLVDQGTVSWDLRAEEQKQKTNEIQDEDHQIKRKMDRITAAAVRFKALVRQQMDFTRKEQMKRNSSLADFMLAPFYFLNTPGIDEHHDVDDSTLKFTPDFHKTFERIFEPFRAGPDALLRAADRLHCRMAGNCSHEEWVEEQQIYANEKQDIEERHDDVEEVSIWDLYSKWCGVLRSYKQTGYSRSMTIIVEEDLKKQPKSRWEQFRGRFRGHAVFGFMLGVLGAYLFSFWAPQGDAYAFVYYFVSYDDFVEGRCAATNSTSDESPWCSTFEYLLMSRTTMWVSHAASLNVQRNFVGVVFCGITKATVMGMLIAIYFSTVFKTISGLEQAAHPMQFLDAILMWWTRSDHIHQISTWHLHVWKLARDSILHNDVKNILDRYENVVLAYLAISFWLITDSAIQVAIFNNAPNLMAGAALLLVCGSTFVCVYQALRVHYLQSQHVGTLRRMEEATYLNASPEVEHQRRLIQAMIGRLGGGGDYQTRLLYMPLNPTFQKALLTYFITAGVAVAARLIGETFVISSIKRAGAVSALYPTTTTAAPYLVQIVP